MLADRPWRRLPAELALAALGWAGVLWALGGPPPVPVPEPTPMEARLVELPTPPPPKPAPPHARPKPAPPHARPRPAPPRVRARPAPPHPVPHPAPPHRPAAPRPAAHHAAARPLTQATRPTRPAELPHQPGTEASPGAEATPEAPRPPGGGRQGAHALYRPMPDVPADLRDEPLQAEAIASFQVAADGSTTVTLVHGTPSPRLNQWLMATFRTWRFAPALEDGHPVPSTLEIRVPISIY